METIRVFTIGFTKSSAEAFFTTLKEAGVRRVVDVRRNNRSQLAGFAKQDDLQYFLRAICGIDYVHLPELAPSQEMLDEYRQQKSDWDRYERSFLALLTQRRVEQTVPRELFDHGCLLCSEDSPQRCHRRLTVEYLQRHWGNLEIVHLLPQR